MKCPNCGETLEADANYCPLCGNETKIRRKREAGYEEGKPFGIHGRGPDIGKKSTSGWFRQPNNEELTEPGHEYSDSYSIPNNPEYRWEQEPESQGIEESEVKQDQYARSIESAGAAYEERPNYRRVENRSVSSNRIGTKKIIIGGIAAAVLAFVLVFGLWNLRYANEPCDWCGRTPSVVFKTSDGSKAYVCKECMRYCMLCERKRATKHYENMAGTMVFVCDECYREVTED